MVYIICMWPEGTGIYIRQIPSGHGITIKYTEKIHSGDVSITLRCRLCSTRYTTVQIKNCSKSTSAIKIATMKNTDDFHYERKLSHATAKLTLFAVSKGEWDTKDIGKSMKNALYVLRYAKRHLSGRSDI